MHASVHSVHAKGRQLRKRGPLGSYDTRHHKELGVLKIVKSILNHTISCDGVVLSLRIFRGTVPQ